MTKAPNSGKIQLENVRFRGVFLDNKKPRWVQIKGRPGVAKLIKQALMILFIIGVVEMVIISAWTKAVTETKVIASGAITIINVFIWYFVLNAVINNIQDWTLIIGYALGCALGTMATTAYFAGRKNKFSSIFRKYFKKRAAKKYEQKITSSV